MPAINTQQAMDAYGYVYQMAKNIPALSGILNQAISGGWTQQKLEQSIEASPWWQQNADTVRNLAVLHATDPKTYDQNIHNATNLVALKANELGVSMDDATRSRIVWQTLTSNASWDDQVLTNLVANWSQGPKKGATGEYLGNAADLANHMTQLAQNYGVSYTDSYLQQQIKSVQMGANSLAGFENLMRARAKATYPQLANQIDAGMTVRDVADPYISTMAQTLEVDENTITLKDPSIQKALQQRNPDGSATSQPMWQFQRQVKEDPRYDKTNQAKNDAYSTLSKIGKDWGFGS